MRLVLDQGVPLDAADVSEVSDVADFHAMLAISGAAGPSVIRIRLQGLGASKVVDVVRKVLATFDAELKRGALITVNALKITCHRLPIGTAE